ncbi:MAG: NAD(P)/FAD-dependent oxidoreductase [Nannocystaceae bacterium]|nr:FAD-binding protein [bacterium]
MRVELNVHPDLLLDPARLAEAVIAKARLKPRAVAGFEVVRRTIDARKGKVRVHVVAELRLKGEVPASRSFEPPVLPTLGGEPSVAIVGAGPAGMFCAWALALAGVRSVVLERGKPVRERRLDLAGLMRRGALDPESNYCFGEGGAGTFSDGKLYTRSSKRGHVTRVLEAFVAYGASPDILVDGRPHIGTNKLPGVVTTMREHLEAAGVEFRFETRVAALEVRDGRVRGVRLANADVLEVPAVVLAVGHSARDVFRFAAEAGATVEAKSFAVGVRVEHPQAFIDAAQFGALAGHPALGAAAYRLVERVGERGVFSFCMCPGGFIAPAATELGGQVVNGWSPSSRAGAFANSGFVAEVDASVLASHGLDPSDPFAGVDFQRDLEMRAYGAGGGDYVAPAARLDDFVAGRVSTQLPECSYRRGVEPTDLGPVLGTLADPIRQALRQVDERIRGFAGPAGIAVAVESRTSCPVRTVRNPQGLQSPTLEGLFPCGEGAGFAGGIMSAALDGIRVADAIVRSQTRA